MKTSDKQKENVSFEEAYVRLEAILGKLNSGEVSLEDSLELYEEANALMVLCEEKLNRAEQKIETLIKTRTGALALDNEGNPECKPFISNTEI